MFNFGVYHWRRRLRRLCLGLLTVAVASVGRRLVRDRPLLRAVAALPALWGLAVLARTVRTLLQPPPWHVERDKYEALAAVLPLGTADTVVDVGCGTGRSLVGLAPTVAPNATVVGVDVFDDRVILGNGPALARRNAAAAGQSVAPVRGDAASLPVADGAADVLTACRVLHDLPKADAEAALRDARRALAPDGTLGVLELPIPHDDGADPETYWQELVEAAGFTVTQARTHGDSYFVLAATPR